MPVMPVFPFDKSCYETITVYRMARVFYVIVGRRHAGGVAVVLCVKVCAAALDFSWTVC